MKLLCTASFYGKIDFLVHFISFHIFGGGMHELKINTRIVWYSCAKPKFTVLIIIIILNIFIAFLLLPRSPGLNAKPTYVQT